MSMQDKEKAASTHLAAVARTEKVVEGMRAKHDHWVTTESTHLAVALQVQSIQSPDRLSASA